MWRRAGAAVTGLAVVGTVAAAVIIPSIKQSNANLAAYRKSPVIMTCNDPLTRTQVPIRQADLKAIPNIAAQVKRSLVCK